MSRTVAPPSIPVAAALQPLTRRQVGAGTVA